MKTWFVYIIHFDKKYHHCQHYIGITSDIMNRLQKHRQCGGSRLTRAVVRSGGTLDFMFVLNAFPTCEEARACEKRLKKRHESRIF